MFVTGEAAGRKVQAALNSFGNVTIVQVPKTFSPLRARYKARALECD